jgi:hypothetical protein
VFVHPDHPLHLAFHGHVRELLAAPADCDSDGECIDSGCGYRCLSTRDRSDHFYLCLGISDLDNALATAACGCFHHHCAWVHQ